MLGSNTHVHTLGWVLTGFSLKSAMLMGKLTREEVAVVLLSWFGRPLSKISAQRMVAYCGTVEPTMSHVIGSRDNNHWQRLCILSQSYYVVV